MTKKRVKRDDKILKKLAEGLKKTKKESKEKNEESIKETDDSEDFEQEDFVPRATSIPSTARVPVLEAIAGEQPGPVFINRGRPASTDSDEKSDVGYAPKRDDNNEPKYSSSQSSKLYEAKNVRTESLGRSTRSGAETQEVNFRPDERTQGEFSTQERTLKVERFDETQAGKRNFLEIDEVKYKEYEPPR